LSDGAAGIVVRFDFTFQVVNSRLDTKAPPVPGVVEQCSMTPGPGTCPRFFCLCAITLPPRFDKEVTSALWLTSHGAPPDCRNRPYTWLGWEFARLVLPEDITWLWPWWIGDVPKDIYHSDPSSDGS